MITNTKKLLVYKNAKRFVKMRSYLVVDTKTNQKETKDTDAREVRDNQFGFSIIFEACVLIGAFKSPTTIETHLL